MKILIVSDQENTYIWDHFDKEKFKDIELIISCGDLKASYLSFLVTMIPVPLLYVPGNHDIKYLQAPPEGCLDIDNQIITYKNIKIGGLGGCIEYTGGPFQYTENAMRKRTKKFIRSCQRKGGLDIFVTHSPSLGVGDGDDWAHKGFECFHDVYRNLSPKYHLHGHQHLNYGINQKRILNVEETTVINGFSYYILDYTPNESI